MGYYPLRPVFLTTMKRLITKRHIPSIQKSKTLKMKPTLILWIDTKWLKTTAYNNLSSKFDWETPLPSMKHKTFLARGYQWTFYHPKMHKISFPVVSGSTLGYLIPDLTQSSSISLIRYNLPIILRRHKILPDKRKSIALIITNKML